jgi:amidase
MIPDTLNAFVAHGRIGMAGARTGPLAGTTFAVKDLFDVAGLPTGAGSPAWLATHDPATATAPAVQRLLDAGAALVGKTHTDELAWSLNGENVHYGTPVNTRAPSRIPGGSSSGSVAAVAGGAVDFAVGSDTGGSVRLPASYCGVIGIRPTHGRIPITGAVPLAPSYDTVGWFARDAELFANVAEVLLASTEAPRTPTRLLIAEDLYASIDPAVRKASAAAITSIEDLLGVARPVTVAGDDLPAWRDAFRVLQSAEAWQTHGAWVQRVNPEFGPGIRDRFAAAARLTAEEIETAEAKRREISVVMTDLLVDDAVLLLPTAPGIAPLKATPQAELEGFRARALALLCAAGHAGMPHISLPLATLDGCPLGVSLLARRGADEMLVQLARRLMRGEAVEPAKVP